MTQISSNYSVNSATGNNFGIVSTSGSPSLPQTGLFLIFLLRQIAVKAQQEQLKQANAFSEMQVTAGRSSAESLKASGSEEKQINLLDAISGAGGALAGGLGIGFGVASSIKSSQAARLDLGVAKLDHAMVKESPFNAQQQREGGLIIDPAHSVAQIKEVARTSQAGVIARGAIAVPEVPADADPAQRAAAIQARDAALQQRTEFTATLRQARDELHTEAKKVSSSAEGLGKSGDSLKTMVTGITGLAQPLSQAGHKEAKAKDEAAKTLADTMNESARSGQQTANSANSGSGQSIQTLDSTLAELQRAYHVKG